MSHALKLAIGIVVAVLLAAPPALTHSLRGRHLTHSANVSMRQYGNCPDPAIYCSFVHGASAWASGYAAYEQLFVMNSGEAARVIAPDEQGDFPRTLFMWPRDGFIDWQGWGVTACKVKEGQNRITLHIPDEKPACVAHVYHENFDYYEHFASNPALGCLAWLECAVPR